MTTHELDTDLNEIVDTVVGDLADSVQAEHPNVTRGAASNLKRLEIGLEIAFAGDLALTASARALILDHLVKTGIDWAVHYNDVVVKALYRPSYERALAAGVPAAQVIAANCQVTLKEARRIVKQLRAEDEAKNPAPAPASDPEVTPQPEADPFGAPAEDADGDS
jgi:hypothetical protein